MKGFGGRRRAPGARPSRTARPVVAARSADAALGRETRGLVGVGRGGAMLGAPETPGRRAASDLAGRPGPGLARVGLPRRLPGLRRLLRPARAAGLLGMLAAGFLYSFVSGPSAFALATIDLPRLQWTDEAVVRRTLALEQGTNVFRIDTAPLERAIEGLPAVADAEVRVGLPEASVVVSIVERVPILAWEAGDARLLVDHAGVLFATVSEAASLPPGVALVQDRRIASEGLAVGDTLDAVDLDVATRLASLTPADIGSTGSDLHVRVTQGDGFVVLGEPGWTAVFGFYSPATRPTEIIPGQVRLLRSFLADREDDVEKVILASETSGTYVPKPTSPD